MHFTTFIIPLIAALGVSAAPALEDERGNGWEWEIRDYEVDFGSGGTGTYVNVFAPSHGKVKGFSADCYNSNQNSHFAPCHGPGNGKLLSYRWTYGDNGIIQELLLSLESGDKWAAGAKNKLELHPKKTDYNVTAHRIN